MCFFIHCLPPIQIFKSVNRFNSFIMYPGAAHSVAVHTIYNLISKSDVYQKNDDGNFFAEVISHLINGI
jgi:hypothetical protein